MKSKTIKIKVENTDGLFYKVDDVAVIIRTKAGIQKQVDVYTRGRVLYASIGNGFIALSSNKGTSSTSYKWVELVPLNNNEFEYIEPHCGYIWR